MANYRLRIGVSLVTLPTWLLGKAINEMFAISGTTHAGSPAAPGEVAEIYCQSTRRLSYSNIATDGGTNIVIACTGGHSDSSNNAVTAIDLADNAPTWRLLKANFTPSLENVAYSQTTPTVEPISRHGYNTIQWSSTLDRLMLHTAPIAYSNGQAEILATCGFNMATGLFDPHTTYADGVTGPLCRSSDDFVWARYGNDGNLLWKWNPATDTWSQAGSFSNTIPKQLAHDSLRDQLFGLSWGNGGGGNGTNPGRNSYVYRTAGTTATSITLNPVGGSGYPAGNAVQQFDADAVASWPIETYPPGIPGGTDCAIDYGAISDRFYWADGLSGRIYYAIPSSGTTWDFGILSLTGPTLPPTDYSHARMKVFNIAGAEVAVFMQSGHTTLYAVRLA